jgi:DNA invertase Pin-like site-specific DNA recombinase
VSVVIRRLLVVLRGAGHKLKRLMFMSTNNSKSSTASNGTRTAIYCRVSTTDQNCEMQLRELREYVARRGWESAGEYVDTGFSGAKSSRPALNSLVADAAQRRLDIVMVWKIDRFGRSVLHLNQQLAALTS